VQTYKIAGIITEMDVRYERLKKQAQPYIYNGNMKADISFALNDEAINKAKEFYPGLSEADLEYLLYGIWFYDKLLDFDGMMLHASAVATEKRAYLFTAFSGVGKSTHTAYWKELLDDAVIVNDDKPALRFVEDKLYVYGTPFSGKHDISVNSRFLLGGICFLERGDENFIENITAAEALPLILPQTTSRIGEDRISKKLSLIDRVLNYSKLYKMRCINDISAAKMSYEKMKVSMRVRLSQLFDVMEETLSKGGTVAFATNGRSMQPLLHDGDTVTVKRMEDYKKGDLILFRKKDGGFVIHRIIKKKKELIFTQGDSLFEIDEPIKKEDILGAVTEIIYPEKTIKATDSRYKLYKFLYVSSLGKSLRLLKRKLSKQKNHIG